MSKKEHTTPKAEETAKQQPEPDEAVAQTADMEQEETASEPSETDKMQELGEKLAALNDKYLRLYSEYENYRKRTNQEKADLLLNGSREMMKAILPVVDDFERALAATGDDEGVQLIYNKLMKILGQKGSRRWSRKERSLTSRCTKPSPRYRPPTPSRKAWWSMWWRKATTSTTRCCATPRSLWCVDR